MHHAQSYMNSIGGGGLPTAPLSPAQATQLNACLKQDAVNYLYSGCVTIGDAMQAIEKSLYSWATVKLYYSTFYLLRSTLALSGHALIYDGTKPRSILGNSGQSPTNISGNPRGTHQAVIQMFSTSFPGNPLLSQEIGNSSPFKWMMAKRENANYHAGRFPDPICPEHFKKIVSFGVRKSTGQYISDQSYLYSFDPDHAALALPIETLKHVLKHPQLGTAANYDDESKRFFRSVFSDKSGPIQDFLALLNT